MRWGSRQAASARMLLVFAAISMFCGVGTARAQSQRSASGSATIVQPVGVGVAFDVRSQVLTSIFLSGQVGEQLSLFWLGKHTGASSPGTGMQVYTGPGNIVVLSSGVVSIDLVEVGPVAGHTRRTGEVGNMLVLAQFN